MFGADETVRSLCRDELMAEVGGGMEEDAASGGDPSIGRRRHGPKSRRRHGPKSFGHADCFIVAHMAQNVTVYYRISTRIVFGH